MLVSSRANGEGEKTLLWHEVMTVKDCEKKKKAEGTGEPNLFETPAAEKRF